MKEKTSQVERRTPIQINKKSKIMLREINTTSQGKSCKKLTAEVTAVLAEVLN